MKTYNEKIFILVLATFLFVVSAKFSMNSMESRDTDTKMDGLYPSIYVEDNLYFYTGEEILPDKGESLKKTVSRVVSINIRPAAEGEINLPYPEASYLKHADDVLVEMEGSWIIFKKEVEKPMDFHQYISHIQDKNSEYNNLAEERNGYHEFSQLAMNFLSDEEVKEIIRNQWEYTLTVNGEPVQKNGEIAVEKGPVTVKVTERRAASPVMALDEYMKGAVSGDSFISHIDFLESIPDEEVVADGTVVQGFTYTFGQENPLEKLEFRISEEMMVRLGLETTDISISIKQ